MHPEAIERIQTDSLNCCAPLDSLQGWDIDAWQLGRSTREQKVIWKRHNAGARIKFDLCTTQDTGQVGFIARKFHRFHTGHQRKG